jgi:protein-disulfide isomerase
MSENNPQPNPSISKTERRRQVKFPWLAVLVPLAFLLGLGTGYFLWGTKALQAAQQPQTVASAEQAVAQVTVPADVQRYDIPVDDDYIYGNADAPITIVEFSDFECPYCQRWYDQVWTRLREEYPDQVRLVYRDFPLPGHPNSTPAAEAANCAGEQDEYYAFHDLLFKGELGLSIDAYLSYAGELGLNQDDFKQCLEERRYQAEVEADAAWAANLGVSSTPTFFINGIPLVGAQPYEVFKQVIDLELAGKIPTE